MIRNNTITITLNMIMRKNKHLCTSCFGGAVPGAPRPRIPAAPGFKFVFAMFCSVLRCFAMFCTDLLLFIFAHYHYHLLTLLSWLSSLMPLSWSSSALSLLLIIIIFNIIIMLIIEVDLSFVGKCLSQGPHLGSSRRLRVQTWRPLTYVSHILRFKMILGVVEFQLDQNI